jgi:hypothetical protein
LILKEKSRKKLSPYLGAELVEGVSVDGWFDLKTDEEESGPLGAIRISVRYKTHLKQPFTKSLQSPTKIVARTKVTLYCHHSVVSLKA